MFNWIGDIIEDIRIWFIDRDLEKIEKMRIRDRYEEAKTELLLRKYSDKQHIHEVGTELLKARRGK